MSAKSTQKKVKTQEEIIEAATRKLAKVFGLMFNEAHIRSLNDIYKLSLITPNEDYKTNVLSTDKKKNWTVSTQLKSTGVWFINQVIDELNKYDNISGKQFRKWVDDFITDDDSYVKNIMIVSSARDFIEHDNLSYDINNLNYTTAIAEYIRIKSNHVDKSFADVMAKHINKFFIVVCSVVATLLVDTISTLLPMHIIRSLIIVSLTLAKLSPNFVNAFYIYDETLTNEMKAAKLNKVAKDNDNKKTDANDDDANEDQNDLSDNDADEKASTKKVTDTKEKAPTKKSTDTKEKASVKKSTDAKDAESAKKSTEVKEKAPAKKSTEVKEKTPAKKSTSAKEKTPVKKDNKSDDVKNNKSKTLVKEEEYDDDLGDL